MKKILSTLIAFLLCTLIFTSCAATEWRYDAEHHWMVIHSKYGASIQPIWNMGEHVDEDGNCKCDVCGFEYSIPKDDVCEHIWSEYKSNAYVHWREYTCGCPWPEIVEEHVDADANSTCDVCGLALTAPACEHVWSDKTYNYTVAGYHTTEKVKRCTLCDADSQAIDYGDGNIYKISIYEEDSALLLNTIPSHAKAGTPFVIVVPDLKNADISIFINGREYSFFSRLDENGNEEPYRPFVVPTEDIAIDIVIDYYSDDYMTLIEVYNELTSVDSAFVQKYYGKYESGALVAIMTSREEMYPDVIVYDTVGDYIFEMGNPNPIRVLYEGQFYSLAAAYASGYITDSDLAAIYEIHIAN